MGQRLSEEDGILRFLHAMTFGKAWAMDVERVRSRLRERGITPDEPDRVIIAGIEEFIESGELFGSPLKESVPWKRK